jgi:hypothetical protein
MTTFQEWEAGVKRILKLGIRETRRKSRSWLHGSLSIRWRRLIIFDWRYEGVSPKHCGIFHFG